MHANLFIRLLVFSLILGICNAEPKNAWTKEELTKNEILRMLPGDIRGTVGVDPDAAFKALVDAGEDIYPLLSELLFESDDHFFKNNIIKILEISKGDKKIPIQASKKYIELNSRREKIDSVVISAIGLLEVCGGENELKYLRQCMSLPERPYGMYVESSLKALEKKLKKQELDSRAKNRAENERESIAQNKINSASVASQDTNSVSTTQIYWPWLVGVSLIIVIASIFLKRRS